MSPRPGYRPCVGIFLLNRQGRSSSASGATWPRTAWQMPQGGIDRGETPAEAGQREMLEEIGTDRAELLAESRSGAPTTCRPRPPRRAGAGDIAGQTQKWLAYRFTGSDDDIRLDVAASRVQRLALGGRRGSRRPDRPVQARRLSQRRRRVPSPMGLTMTVDGIGRGLRRSSDGGSLGNAAGRGPERDRGCCHDRRRLQRLRLGRCDRLGRGSAAAGRSRFWRWRRRHDRCGDASAAG